MSKENDKIRWAVVQPLTGGFPIGIEDEVGHPPEFIINNSADNTLQYINYMNNTRELDIPVINMDWEVDYFLTEEDESLFSTVNKDIDLVCYLPICSGLSMLNNVTTGKNARGDADNNQNQNMYQLSNFILEKIKPKVAVFENAPNAYTNSGKGVLDRLVGIGKDKEYTCTIEKVDSYDHGIPQHRQRTFIYYWDSDTVPYMQHKKLKTPSLTEYLKCIPESASLQDCYPMGSDSARDYAYECITELYNEKNHESIYDIFLDYEKPMTCSGRTFLRRRDNFAAAIEWSKKKVKESQDDEEKLDWYAKGLKGLEHCRDKTNDGKGFWDSSVAVFSHREYINALIGKNITALCHPEVDRSFNVRELTWLMGLPHEYELMEPKKNFGMLTQNVTVHAGRHAGRNVVDYLRGDLDRSIYSFMKYNHRKNRIDYQHSDKPSAKLDIFSETKTEE